MNLKRKRKKGRGGFFRSLFRITIILAFVAGVGYIGYQYLPIVQGGVHRLLALVESFFEGNGWESLISGGVFLFFIWAILENIGDKSKE
ncbi:hypothetical protein J6TS7_38160 [Paenibacillus dendritiformis]|nr:hypothetical protein J6TS7_38160 [Paenibacillus dendritiformis]